MTRKSLLGILLGAIVFASTPSARAAVATANIQVTGTTNPFTISYVLAQQATSLQWKVFPVGSSTPVRTVTEADNSATGVMGAGTHGTATGNLPPILWDGTNNSGQSVPGGNYYVQIQTAGAAMPALTNLTALAPPANSGWRNNKGDSLDTPPRIEARNVYGGGAVSDPASPLHNMSYLGAAKTNANNNGSSGAVAVYPDSTTSFVTLLTDRGAEGALDYSSAAVESDNTLLLGGQGAKKLVNVDPVTGATIAVYGAGKIDVRTMQVFGSGPTARVYFVDDQTPNTGLTGSIALLNPISNTTGTLIYQTIVPQSAMPTVNVYGLVVNHTETALYVSGYVATDSGDFIYRFDKQGDGTWAANTAFNTGSAAVIAGLLHPGRLRGVTLSPDDKVLWFSEVDALAAELDQQRIVGIDADTGADLGANYRISTYVSGSNYFTPQGMVTVAGNQNHNASTPYNLCVAGYNSIAASTSANANAVFAPPDSGSSDTTVSAPFANTNATQVTITVAPTVTNITNSSATISWTTDLGSTGVVHYGGATGVYTSPDVTVPGNATSHVVNLPNLVPGGTYFFEVESGLSPLTPATAAGQFTTLPNITLVSEGLSAFQTTATLTIETNVPCAGVVHWGDNPTTFNLTDIPVSTGATKNATVAFTGLAAGKTYYYQLALTGTNATPLTTLTSVFATAATGGSAGTITDNAFGLAQKVDLVGGSGTGAVSLPAQGIPALSLAQSADLPVNIFGHGVVAYNNFMYCIGGADLNDAATNSIYFIKINADGSLDATGGWQPTTNALPVNRKEIPNSCFAYSGNLYVVGGADETGTATTTVLYAPINPTTGDIGTWKGVDVSQTPPILENPMPGARTRGSARVADGYILVSGGAGGGVHSTNYVAQIRPDGSTGTWQTTTPLNGTRWKQHTIVNNHQVYSIGGDSGSGSHIASVSVGTEQPGATLSAFFLAEDYPTHGTSPTDVPHYAMAAGMLGGKIVTAGGGNLSGVTGEDNARAVISYSSVESDDITGPWTASADVLPTGVEDMDGAVYNGNLYVVGGRTLGVQGTSTTVPATTGIAQTVIITTATDPAGPAFAYAGTLESKILDLGAVTNLKHLAVAGTGVSASSVEVRYRFANGDAVFTDYYTMSGTDTEISGGGRYFQYQLVLKGNGASTPTVTSVTLTTAAGGPLPLSTADVKRALTIAAGLDAASAADMARLNVDGVPGIAATDAVKIQRTINGH